MPLVSVIVPVYNVAPYLSKCMTSIVNQSLSDIEVIVVDDGSTDGSAEICDSFAAADVRVHVIHQINSGVSCARNRGLDAATGKYIAFCDSDDYWGFTHLEGLIHAVTENHSDSAVVSFYIVDELGTIIRSIQHREGFVQFDTQNDRFEYIFQEILTGRVGWEIWSRLFLRDIIEQHNIRFCENCGNFAEDLGFVVLYSFFSRGEVSVNRNSYYYLQRTGSMMGSSKKTIKLNQVNEVSKYVYSFSQTAFSKQVLEKTFPLLHAAIMYNQMFKLLLQSEETAKAAFQVVTDPVWMRRFLRGMLFHRRTLKKYFGKKEAWRIILLSHYTIHQKPILFRLERSFINRLIIVVD